MVTAFSHHRERAMLFPGAKSARSVARMIGDECVVMNAAGELL